MMNGSTEEYCPLISVIVPVYKVEQYLPKCIESIINQTYRNLEIILVDDGSSDGCPQICDEYANKDNRIYVVHKDNHGIGFARNSGIDISTGDYLMFVDSDDYLPSDAVEILHTKIEKDESDMVIGNFIKVFDDGTQKPSSYGWMNNTVIKTNKALEFCGSSIHPIHCYVWAKMYRRAVFSNLRFSSLTSGEDVEILPKIICACNRISLIDNVIYYYYQRDTSIVHNRTDERQRDSLIANLSVGRFLLDKGYIEAAKHYYAGSVIAIVNMDDRRAGRKLLKQSYSKVDVKKFRNKGVLFYIAWMGMYFPFCFRSIVAVDRKFKSVCKMTHRESEK